MISRISRAQEEERLSIVDARSTLSHCVSDVGSGTLDIERVTVEGYPNSKDIPPGYE
jgi:hypothetical protein